MLAFIGTDILLVGIPNRTWNLTSHARVEISNKDGTCLLIRLFAVRNDNLVQANGGYR
jgi:hypothetical protein